MIRLALLGTLVAPIVLAAQQVDLTGAGNRPSAVVIREALAGPHVVIGGTGRLDFPRDSTITSTVIVVGRPTYLASTVKGSVIVIGGDLFLRPGVNVSGRAVAIGGFVARTVLGRVGGDVTSYPDETYAATTQGSTYRLSYANLATQVDPQPTFDLAGLQGLLMPSYDRVDGLTLPVGVQANLADGKLHIEPRVSYLSRIGTLDPAVTIDVNPDGEYAFELFGGRSTRSNDKWVDGDVLNSLGAISLGNDSRNYFRSTRAEGRAFYRPVREGWVLAPYVGARAERVRSITTGNVFSFFGRHSIEKIRRPNPSVEEGDITSGLLGTEFIDTAGVVISQLRGEVEQSFATMAGTSRFTQLTLDGNVGFPTFGTQRLHFRGHAVLTQGDSTPRARYAYLGGGGTLPLLEQLEQGGDRLVFLESRYSIPIDRVVLPFIGVPVVGLWHIMGSAGVGSLPKLEQELRVSLKLSVVSFYFTTDVGGSRHAEFGSGLSLH